MKGSALTRLPACGKLQRLKISGSPVYISVRVYLRQAHIKLPATIEQATAGNKGVLISIEGAVAAVEHHASGIGLLQIADADGAAERACTICGRAHTALYLDRARRGGNVRYVYKEGGLLFRVVDWYTVKSDIDTGRVCAAYMQAGIAYAVSRIGSGSAGRGELQQYRQVLSHILLFQVLGRDIGFGKGRVRTGTQRAYLYSLQVVIFLVYFFCSNGILCVIIVEGVGCCLLRMGINNGANRQRCQEKQLFKHGQWFLSVNQGLMLRSAIYRLDNHVV